MNLLLIYLISRLIYWISRKELGAVVFQLTSFSWNLSVHRAIRFLNTLSGVFAWPRFFFKSKDLDEKVSEEAMALQANLAALASRGSVSARYVEHKIIFAHQVPTLLLTQVCWAGLSLPEPCEKPDEQASGNKGTSHVLAIPPFGICFGFPSLTDICLSFIYWQQFLSPKNFRLPLSFFFRWPVFFS